MTEECCWTTEGTRCVFQAHAEPSGPAAASTLEAIAESGEDDVIGTFANWGLALHFRGDGAEAPDAQAHEPLFPEFQRAPLSDETRKKYSDELFEQIFDERRLHFEKLYGKTTQEQPQGRTDFAIPERVCLRCGCYERFQDVTEECFWTTEGTCCVFQAHAEPSASAAASTLEAIAESEEDDVVGASATLGVGPALQGVTLAGS